MAENSGEVRPQPEFEITKEPREGQEALAERAAEQRPQTEAAKSKQTPQFSPPASVVQATPDPQTSSPKQGTSKSPTGDLDAQNTDRIERQWVERAKTIVAHTQDDPYNQKKQMSKMK